MAINNLEKFKKQKLTEKDLENYSLKINAIFNEMNLATESLWTAKRDYNLKKITKDGVLEKKAEYKKVERQFRDTKKTKVFKNNLINIKKIAQHEDKNSKDYNEILKEKEYAIKLYKDFKDVVHNKGKYGTLTKLNSYAVQVNNLKFQYSDDQPFVIDDVNFKINHGEYVAIVGHNGSGKSTLSKLLIGVLNAQEGEISIFGNTLNQQNIDRVRQFIGIVFQNPDNQFIGSTVKDDIAFGLENKRVDPKDMQNIIEKSAKRVGMDQFLDKEPLMLSGGQKQRVAIASTLALDPEIIIFDEATSMLDPKGKKEIKEIMVDLKNQGNKTILSITHDMDEILNATKVLVMNGGKVLRMGTPDEIMSDRKFLRSIHLDMPFVGVVEDALQQEGLDIKLGSKNMDELADEIWEA